MGNRGGRIHRDDRTLTNSRWKSKAWIICVLAFNGWHREVMGKGYTEVFFCDEATALAAGHRPCYLCQRRRALEFAAAFGGNLKAPQIDAILHRERRAAPLLQPLGEIPAGAMIRDQNSDWLLTGTARRVWSHAGYGTAAPLPPPSTKVLCLTPPSTLRALKNGYSPVLHPSAR